MKTLSKVLCLLMVAAMCMSFFGASASALSFSVGGTGSSSTGGIRIPVGGSGTDETDDDDDISAPATTPAIDEGFGAGEPDETEGYSPEIDKEEDEDFSNAIDKMAEALKNGQKTLKFNGYFCFDKELVIDAGMDVAIVLANGAEVEDTDNIIVNGTVRISGSGCMGALPTVNDGGKLIISGGSFTEDPSKYLADGYKVDTTSGYFDVVKDNETKEEPEADEKPKDEDTSTYIDIDEEGLKTIVLTPNEFNKGTDERITANYNSNDVNFQFFFLVSTTSEEVTGEDFLTPEVDFTVDHTGKGNSIVYLKNSFLNGKDEGYYWFGGGRYSGSSVDLKSVRYSTTTLHITKKDVDSTGDGTGGLYLYVNDKQYNSNGGWETGDGALYFYWTPIDPDISASIYRIKIQDVDEPAHVYYLNNEQWMDYGNGNFYIGESQFLNQLDKGVYNITVMAKVNDNSKIELTGSCDFRVLQDPAPVLEFSGTYKHVINSGKTLKLKCSEPIAAVYAGKNGTKLSNFDYTMYKLSNDGKTLTLTAQFLNERAAGYSYALWVEDASGNQSNEVYFQILTTAQANASVDTGDASDIALWVTFLVLSGAAIAVALPRVKKHGSEE